MLPYHIRQILICGYTIFTIFAVGILTATLNYVFSVNINVYLDVYVADFSSPAILLPIMVILSPVLTLLYQKKPDKIMNLSFLVGFVTCVVGLVGFNYNSVYEIVFLLLGFSVIVTNIFFLSHRLSCLLNKPYLAIFFVGYCFFIMRITMILVDYLFKQQIFLSIEYVLLSISLVFLFMFVVNVFLASNSKKDLKISFKNFFNKYFIYLINFFKHEIVLNLCFLFFLNGIIHGAISQYITHYISQLDHQALDEIFVFEIIMYLVFLLILFIIGFFMKERDIHSLFRIFFISSVVLCINVILVILNDQSYILNDFLMVDYTWFWIYVFVMLLINYYNSFKSHQLHLMMIVGYILYLFGNTFIQWVDMIFVSVKISLYFAIGAIFFMLYINKIIKKKLFDG